MKLDMLAVHDAKVGEYMTPFFSQSVGAAVRSFGDAVNKGGEEVVAQHPEDFSLHHVGTWYSDGVLEVFKPVLVCEAVNLKTVRE